MNLVDDNKPQVMEQGRNLHMLIDHKGFQRLRRNLQDAGGVLQKLSLLRLRGVPVPRCDSDALLLAELREPPELVVDEGLKRRNIEDAHRLRRILLKQRQDREKCRLRLARRGGRREKDVGVGAEDGVAGRILHAPEALPAGTVDIILNKRGISLKYIHIVNSAKPLFLSSETASDSA